jgi:2-iminobutanoate/2-iminopropanoate deaminase
MWKVLNVGVALGFGIDFYLRKQAEQPKEIRTMKAPAPIGPYSQAIKQNGVLYCSGKSNLTLKSKGQIGIDPENENKISPKLEEQTKQTLKNLGEILKAGGSDFDKVMKTTVLLSDMNDFAKVNEIYSTCKFF